MRNQDSAATRPKRNELRHRDSRRRAQKNGKVLYESENHCPQNKTRLNQTSHFKSQGYGIIQGKLAKKSLIAFLN